jgi:hypothetical protein
MAKGLNGELVFNAKDVPVGRTGGEQYGYKRSLAVTVEVQMEILDRRDAYETVDHTMVTKPLDFAITTAVWQPGWNDMVAGGATVEPLRELVTYLNGFDAESVAALADLAEWHLNSMTAGCAHQGPPVMKDGTYGPEVDFDQTPPCPVTGYKYGSAWLLRPLPDGFHKRVRELFGKADDLSKIWSASSL